MEKPNSQNEKNSLRPIIGLLVLVAVVGAVFVGKKNAQEIIAPEPPAEVSAAQKEIPDGHVRRISDGVIIPEEEQVDQLYAVMVENSAEAWPLSGLSQARLVFEAHVEGSIPRLMAIFDDKQEVDIIGPVRSARPYYLDWARGLKAMYVHVGGSPQALNEIKRSEIESLNQFFWSRYFWRAPERYAPHNVYTSTELLREGYQAREYDLTEKITWEYAFENEQTDDAGQAPPVTEITVPFSTQVSLYDATWQYDEDLNSYQRLQGGKVQEDREGDKIYAKNIVAMYAQVEVIDNVGRRFVDTIGKGKAVLFKDGQRFDVIWQKNNKDELLNFFIDEDPVKFNPGSTWIEVIPLSTDIVVEAK